MWGWVKHCFSNYAVFNGRAGRPEYWWFYLFTFLGSFVIGILTYSGIRLSEFRSEVCSGWSRSFRPWQ